MKVLVRISHLSKVHEVPVQLPLVAHRLGVLAQVFIFRDGLDQARIFIKHLLDSGCIGKGPVRPSIGCRWSCSWSIGPRWTARFVASSCTGRLIGISRVARGGRT